MRAAAVMLLHLCLALSIAHSSAETFFGPSATTNKFLIASNESVIISSIVSAGGVLSGDVLISNWFVEDVFQNPNVFLPSASQTPQIFVEKSGDLNLWQPVAIFGQSLGSNVFYRLRISR